MTEDTRGQCRDRAPLRLRTELAALGAAAVLLCVGGLPEARAESFAETNVRAVFLLNFALFIKWPSSAFESPSSPLRYCVLGNQALNSSLAQTLSGEQLGGRLFQLTDAQEPAQWRRCHLLYIDHRTVPPWPRVLAAVKGAPVLTVGDTEALVDAGGVISLVRKGGRLRPLINRDAAARASIQISSKLLRIATLVSESPDQTRP